METKDAHKQPSPQPSAIPSNPTHADCPFLRFGDDSPIIRRQDLIDLASRFSASVEPVVELLRQMKEQNAIQRETNRYVKDASVKQEKQSHWLIMLALGFAIIAAMQLYFGHKQDQTSIRQEATIKATQQVERELVPLAAELRRLVELSKKTQAQVDNIQQTHDQVPGVELVEETDPVKAKKAPMKVRIVPPRPKAGVVPSAPSTPSAAVELPIAKSKDM